MHGRFIALSLCLLLPARAFALLGLELGPLLQLVTGQVQEIQKLTETVGFAKDQAEMLKRLNDGIERTVSQIQSLQQIVERAQGLDPRGVKNLSDLNNLLAQAKGTQALIEDLSVQIDIANQAVARSALQSDTSYRMGQEMVATGAQLAQESQSASPGRAAQISAAASSAQMLSQGVELQTLAQLVELQALMLDFQKSREGKALQEERIRRAQFERQLAQGRKRRKP